MTLEQWALLTPEQRAQHVATYGPPPPGYDAPTATTTIQLPTTVPPPGRKPAATLTKAWLIGAGVVVLLLVVAISTAGLGTSPTTASSPTSATPAPAAASTCGHACATVPYLLGLTATNAAAALDQAGFTGSRDGLLTAPAGSVVSSQDPLPGTSTAKDAPINLDFEVETPALPAPAPTPGPAKTITAREWALIAKSPDQHVGESIVVYGQVEQFDAATGDSTFRASVDGVKHPVKYGYADYETNTVLTGTPGVLGDIVEKDLFRAEVVVSGSLTYDTTLGGSMTVPQLQITKIQTLGTAK